jgi:uncharacterized RDD family membrane protein YckC
LKEADGGDFYCAVCELPPRLASLGARFNGHLLDVMLFGVPLVPLLLGQILDPRGGALFWILCAAGVLGILGVFGLNLYWLRQSGQSIGKRVLRTRIVMLDGSPAPLWRIVFLRMLPLGVAAAGLSLVPPGNLAILIDGAVIFGNERRCIHDYLAGTKVVEAR